MPVYYVVVRSRRDVFPYQIYDIVKTVKTEFSAEKFNQIYRELVLSPEDMQNVQILVFTREEDNPFREMVDNGKA